MKPIEKLIVFGTKQAIVADESTGQKEGVAYDLTGSTRDAENQHDIGLKNNDKLLEFELEDGTTWMCDASTLHEVYPELDPALRPAGKRDSDTETFVLPSTVDAPATERGIVGKIAVKILRVFVKKAFEKAIDLGVKKIALKLEDKHLQYGITEKSELWHEIVDKEGAIKKDAAIFTVDKDFKFHIFKDTAASSKPYFLFIHGTNSDTRGAFIDLQSSAAWSTLHDIYGNNVIAFQHRTLTKSPLENTAELAALLPNNIELHILSHSRGGLIGDILNRYSSNTDAPAGFNNIHTDLLEKEEDRENDIANIYALNALFKEKKIKITKFIRVACPAAGTKLASKRLDHILNVFFNLFGGVFGDILKELLSAAVDSKDNVDVLPGLEAMNPESPFIKILNDPYPKNAIDGKPLAVISGNGRVSFSGQGLLTILGKLFYWQRNDLVVNTDSMYLGVKRKNNIQYFFDQGADVNHVKYFANSKTCEAIELVLKTDEGEAIPGFTSVKQYAVPATDRAIIEHGELPPQPGIPTGNKPIVILLPGIMGSNLTQGDKEIWLNYGHALVGGLMDLKYTLVDEIRADSIVKTSYYKLYKWLSGKYDVVIFPFDWRKPLSESTKALDQKITSLMGHGQPIKIIGHSMGGVLVRDFMVYHRDTWQKLNASKDFRLIFLGAPLGGSHRILTVLFGQDNIIKNLAKLDLFHTKKGLLKMFSKFPGILSLLPLTTDSKNDFTKLKTWTDMRDAFNKPDWPLPDEHDLKIFKEYRDKVLKDWKNLDDYTNISYIAGKDKMTPCGYHLDDVAPTELYFLYTGQGDQSVTWESGIPKELNENSVYYTRVSHGALANDTSIFNGIEEVLSKGQTKLLRNTKPMVRGDEKIFRAEPDIDFDLSETGLTETVLGLRHETEPVGSQIPITVSISNGDLRYASYPILAGHFLNDGILNAEIAIDNYLKGSLRSKHNLGLYPGEIGSNAIFKKMEDSDFKGAIILGMGEPDQLTSFQLARSVEQGVLNYLLDLRGQKAPTNGIGIASLVISSGYGGLSIESSMMATISGVNRANEKIKTLSSTDYGTIQHIEFVELYADKALNCLYALNQIAQRADTATNIILGSKKIKQLLGSRKRIPLDVTEDWWNRITVKHKKVNKDSGELESMVFGASTSDSREEENEIYSSTPLINQFIAEVSTNNQWSSCTAKTLFELLIPNQLKDKLKRKGNISWVLDTKTASYPWELLQDSAANAKPLCVNSGMIRQLSISQYRHSIKRVSEHKALIVADPILNKYIGQLPGAREEGQMVKELLDRSGYPVNDLIGSNASTIIRELFCKDYSIIHLAGHGVYKPKSPKESGMVIGKELFLTVFEIQQMPIVPELVFVNCCHLGYSNNEDEQLYQNRYKLAANIGTELIRIGVKAVIAAGWAVNDNAALEFANVFYEHILDGKTFGDAVKVARGNVYAKFPETNTWGAYQCYGDPFFKLKTSAKSIWSPSYIVPEEAEIHLDNLLNHLQMGTTAKKEALDELLTIMKAVSEHDNFKTPAIREKEARIYQELAMYTEAIEKFEELLCTEKADFSFSCMETYCNTRIKRIVRDIFENKVNDGTLEEGYQKTESVINDLKVLLSTGQTAERQNLLGSAYKRLAMLAPDEAKRTRAYKTAIAHYEMAYAKKTNNNKIYSLSNSIEIAALLNLSNSVKPGGDFTVDKMSYRLRSFDESKKLLEEHRNKLIAQTENYSLDYWNMVALLNIDLCLLLFETKTDSVRWNELEDNFKVIWKKAGSEAKKIAELEHLQFLIHALNKAKGKSTSFSPIGNSISKDKLTIYIAELRSALNAASAKK